MPSWWNSLESVTRLKDILELTVLGAGLVTALIATGIWVTGRRISNLQLQRDRQIAEQSETREKALQERLQTAEVTVSNVSNSLSEAEKKQAQAEGKLLEFQGRLEPRHFDEAKSAAFLKALKQQGTGKVEIGFTDSDFEAERFAVEVEGLLRKVGWKVSFMNGIASNHGRGITIGVKNDQKPPAPAIALAKAFSQAGFQTQFHSWGYEDENLIWVEIGDRP